MSQPEQTPSYFNRRWETSGGTDEVADYKKVCPSAIVACVLAGLSPLAFFHPLMWVIPVLAVCVGVWAAMAFIRQPDELLGRRALRWAMAIAIFCGLTAFTDWAVYRYYLRQEAMSFADLWFGKLFSDKPLEAYELFSHPLNRHLPGRGLEAQYAPGGKNRENFDSYMKTDHMKILTDHDLNPSYKYLQAEFDETPFSEIVSLQYEISWDEMDGRKTRPMIITVSRMKLIDVPYAGWQLQSASFK